MRIEDLSNHVWLKIWSGKWSLLCCSYWAQMYPHTLKVNGRVFLDEVIIIVREGLSGAYAHEERRRSFGMSLAQEVKDNPTRVSEICNVLKNEVDRYLTFIDAYEGKDIDFVRYQEFWNMHIEYYIPHVNVKYVVDYLDSELLEKYLLQFEEARVYAEPVFRRTEEFLISFASIIAHKVALPPHLVLCADKEEMEKYFVSGQFPGREVLEKRWQGTALYTNEDGDYKIITGEEVRRIESALGQQQDTKSLKGTIAYRGIARGVVRIVYDPRDSMEFNEGDILVTGMTRPEFLLLMKKAGAIVTDSGGILSHAAIVARELKKPCLIGTERATKILQTGDVVEVDAEQGIVRKI